MTDALTDVMPSPAPASSPSLVGHLPRLEAAPTVDHEERTRDLPADRYFNRETSWLDFNGRVLECAEDVRTPLLERAKFLAIFASNLDEFFMVRVAGLKRRIETGLAVVSADGLTPSEQLALIAQRTRELIAEHAQVFTDEIRPALAGEGIRIVRWADLTPEQTRRMDEVFELQVFPVLTPLAVDPAHPFPYISGLSLNLAVLVRDPAVEGVEMFARVKVPPNVPRLVRLDDQTWLPLEDLVGAHLPALFPGLEVVQWHVFRVTRNADVEVEEDRDEDLLQALEREIARRRFGPAVRLEVVRDIDEHMLDLLVRELEISDDDVLKIPGLLDLTCLMGLQDVARPDLKQKPTIPGTHPRLVEGEKPADFFAVMREGDVLLHHPYDSFSTSVQRFVEQAAADPHVLAIKQTLYRTSGDSPIVRALIEAAEAGKQVVALVEIKARFDETANIKWARALERAGVHVVYGVVGLKTHAKICLVVRQEAGGIRRYAHVGTGNYNPKTARLYEDLGVLTADQGVGSDLTDLFNVLTGYSRQTEYETLLVAPARLRNGLIEAIGREAEAAAAGSTHARVRIKCNSLVDETLIDALYRASQAGVRVECIVRGICALRPGVPGMSENVTVRSILGRYLEHSRVFDFAAGEELWIGSADMMHRNLDRRVEVLVRVRDAAAAGEVRAMLDSAMDPGTSAWTLLSDGSWRHDILDEDGKALVDHQVGLLKRTRG